MKHNGRRSIHRTLALLIMALMLLIFGAVSAHAATFTCIVADGQYVNVRNRASSTAATWGILHHGDTIEAKPGEIVNGYFKTMFEDRIAYVSVRFFETPVGKDYEVIANGRVACARRLPAMLLDLYSRARQFMFRHGAMLPTEANGLDAKAENTLPPSIWNCCSKIYKLKKIASHVFS